MQLLLYLPVGGLSFVADIGAFVGLRALGAAVIPASVASFILGTAANYMLSILLAFERGRFARHMEMLRFLSVVLVGLGLNTALVWFFVYPLSLHPTLAKIIAVPIVLIWSYLGRRLLVFSDRIPAYLQMGQDAQCARLSGHANEHESATHQNKKTREIEHTTE